MKPCITVISLSLLALIQGCGAHFNSIYRSDSLRGDVDVRSIDAKQRLIFSRQHAQGVFICPEPSPDALSAAASSIDLTASQLGKASGLGLGGMSSESAGSIGLRTQTISLLRDQMTQLCLRRMANIVTDDQYSEELRRLQVSALGMLAIEQLTGAIKAPPVLVSVSADRSTAKPKEGDDATPEANVKLAAGGKVEGTATDPKSVTEVSSAVVKILEMILKEGFSGKACRDAQDALFAALKQKAMPEPSVKAMLDSCPNIASDLTSASLFLDRAQEARVSKEGVQAAVETIAKTTGASVLAQSEAVRQRVRAFAQTDNRPLQGYRIKLFACASMAGGVLSGFSDKLQPLTVRPIEVEQLSDSEFIRRSLILDPSKKPLAKVFYDGPNDGEEKAFAERIAADLKTSVASIAGPGAQINVVANPPGSASTPFYLSAWVCL